MESTADGGRNEIVLRYGEGDEDYAAIFVRNGRTGPAGADGKDGKDGQDGQQGPPGNDGQPGPAGADGKDGDTPYIGANGNWWIGGTDTGVSAGGGGSGGGGLVVVYDTGDETANYSAEEIEEFFRNGNEVVFEQPDGKGSLVYYLQFIDPGVVVFETYLGTSETDEIWRHVYVQSDKRIIYGEIRDPIIRKTSQLENDSGFISAPATAAVGQTIVVSEVDEDGKPTKWEAVNLPGSGGFTIRDISGEVVDQDFDFTSAGPGLYFSSEVIHFRYIRWDANWEELSPGTYDGSGLFLVTYEPDNGWAVVDIAAGATLVFFSETGYEGKYDECWHNMSYVVGQEPE